MECLYGVARDVDGNKHVQVQLFIRGGVHLLEKVVTPAQWTSLGLDDPGKLYAAVVKHVAQEIKDRKTKRAATDAIPVKEADVLTELTRIGGAL